MKIAVIGSGISGLSAAWLLRNNYDITLFEKNNYLGGHANTSIIDYNGKKIAVDSGFIIFNFKTYPNLTAFFKLLNVKIKKSYMSFGIFDLDTGFEYGGNNLLGFFSQKQNLLNIKFLRMFKDILKFNNRAAKIIKRGEYIKGQTLSEFVEDLKLGDYFKQYYLFSVASAIWSCPLEKIKDYPAAAFLQFFYNHGLLNTIRRPIWYTIDGGSKEYVKKISADLSDKIKLDTPIISAYQAGDKIVLTDIHQKKCEFDHVIFACHADQSLKIILDKTQHETDLLSKIKYSHNVAILHKDTTQMPQMKKSWSSWVYLSSKIKNKVSVSYWMNNLQRIDKNYPLFVTLNPINKIDQQDIFGRYEYSHPIFDHATLYTQTNLDLIQGKRKLWFCGAWTRHGFHEDGLVSALNIADRFGVKAPWQK